MKIVATAAIGLCVSIAGCGVPSSLPKADVMITLDGVHHTCLVALSKEAEGSSIACTDIVAFLRDELRLSTGASYDLRSTPQVSEAEASSVRKSLNIAGYRPIGNP